MGTVGRQSGQVRLAVCRGTTRRELEALVLQHTQPLACCNTDEWGGYGGLPERQRVHRTVNHSHKQWAKDQDGDGLWRGPHQHRRGPVDGPEKLPAHLQGRVQVVPLPVLRRA